MENVTYLLGAGASRQCLPIVSEMHKEVTNVAGMFEYDYSHVKDMLGESVEKEKVAFLVEDLKWLADICNLKRNFSVDTYAKQLLLSSRLTEYEKLKNTLTLYFTLQQKYKSPDVRYGNFWASLLNEKDKFPENIKILSWNYDFQLEMTYQDFSNSISLTQSSKLLNIVSNKNVDQATATNKFTIFKLNGSATYNSEVIERGHNYIMDNLTTLSKEETIKLAIDYYSKSSFKSVVQLLTHLSFAWEHKINSMFYEKMQEGLETTTILVVIGYSFPYFNRDIDKLILSKYMPNLKKVYFQDEKPDNIKERFNAINPKILNENLVPIKDTYQFYFPNEL